MVTAVSSNIATYTDNDGHRYTARWEVVTPELAEYYLSLQRNRNRFEILFGKAYSRMMGRKRWYVTHQGIAFDDNVDKKHPNGHLCDGHHRLWAISNSGVPQLLLVVRGITEKAFLVTDTGKGRTPGDALRLFLDIHDANSVAACLKWMWMYDHGRIASINTSTRMIRDEIIVGALKFPNILKNYSRYKSLEESKMFSSSMAAWLDTCFTEANPELAQTFGDRMFFGLNLEFGPVYKLRNSIWKKVKDPFTKMNWAQVSKDIIHLWNIEYARETGTKQIKDDSIIAGRPPTEWTKDDYARAGLADEFDNGEDNEY